MFPSKKRLDNFSPLIGGWMFRRLRCVQIFLSTSTGGYYGTKVLVLLIVLIVTIENNIPGILLIL